MKASLFPAVESLEPRIALALSVINPLPDVIAGIGATGLTVDLDTLFNPASSYHTFVKFTTNFDSDPNTDGVQGDIIIELFDDSAPLTVQNFLTYVNGSGHGDYDGTFFHRAAFNGATPFVLQGGGFEATNLSAHIPVGPAVHNEFDPEDASRSNLLGTIAMAKTPTGPNTATSEFFFNLGDNSANLDAQNGGFTVFGRVTQGMDVVNAIAGQTRINLTSVNGALNDLPVDSTYTTGIPTPAQLFTITQAMVLPAVHADSPGYTYTFTVTGEGTESASSVVRATRAEDFLSLKYLPGKSGVAEVTVTATKEGESVVDSFLVTVKPNLTAEIPTDLLPVIITPGDSSSVKVKLINTGAAPVNSQVEVKFYLSRVDGRDAGGNPLGSDPDGVQLDLATDTPVGSLVTNLKLGSGSAKTLVGHIQIPPVLAAIQGEGFRVLASVSPVAGSTLDELFSDDNGAAGESLHSLYNVFGSFSVPTADGNVARKNVPLTYTDAAGHEVTFTLKNGGFGQIFVEGDELDLQLQGTTATSRLQAKVDAPGVHTSLRDILTAENTAPGAAQDPLGTVDLGSVDAHGNIFFRGGVKSLTLGDLTASEATQSLQLGVFTRIAKGDTALSADPAQATTLRLGTVTDYNLVSGMPIASLKAAAWLDVNPASESLKTAALSSFKIAGNFEADLFTSSMTGPKLKTFTVGGVLKNAGVNLASDVGKVTLGAMSGSFFYVGVSGIPTEPPATETTPAITTDFTVLPRTLDRFVIKGAPNAPDLLQASQIVAQTIGSISIQSVDPESGSAEFPFGVVAEAIKSYLREGTKLSRLTTPGTFDTEGNYEGRILQPAG